MTAGCRSRKQKKLLARQPFCRKETIHKTEEEKYEEKIQAQCLQATLAPIPDDAAGTFVPADQQLYSHGGIVIAFKKLNFAKRHICKSLVRTG